MVVNAPDSPVQAEVIFVIEATAANGAYISELKTNYIIPTLEYFHGGALEEGCSSGSEYSIVAYKSADCHPGVPVTTYGPFNNPQSIVEAVDRIQYIGGHAESRACITEALGTVLTCIDELGRNDVPTHVLLLCCSPPYSSYAGGLVPTGAPATVEQAARMLGDRGVQVSVAAARRILPLIALYEHAGGELHQAQQRNYAKDPRHLVLLRGYSLKERPPSPAPPPVPEIQTDMYGQSRNSAVAVVAPMPRAQQPSFARAAHPPLPALGHAGAAPLAGPPGPAGPPAPARPAWLTPPRQPLYPTNSALLNQLAQPSSHPPIPPSHVAQRMPGMVNAGASSSGQAPPGQVQVQAAQQSQPQPPIQLQRSYIWSGVIEWMEKVKSPGDQLKTSKHLPCQVSASSKDIEPELKAESWPNKLLMQLMPKQLISSIGGQYLKDSKSVLFHMQPSEALEALTKVMVNGFAGCVHFQPSPPQCDIKVLILLYTPEKKVYLGFIPNNQATFVDRLKKVIQQQKITQIINKQMPNASGAAGGMAGNMANAGMAGAGSMAPGGMSTGGMGVGQVGQVGQMAPGPSQTMVQPQMQQHPQGMMLGGGMGGQVGQVGPVGQVGQVGPVGQVGGKGPRPVHQLDGLEAARQQNLEKIQQLQQTLEVAHQQEAQFKSQMDIMSHLHAAQQQEHHYKHLEEQQRKHQLQQQLQQQLRGSAAGAGHPSRLMRPHLPANNPGLRHLLQQQPQYRPSGSAVRPTAQTQQFEDVGNYNEFL